MTFQRKTAGSPANVAAIKRRLSGAWVACSTLKRRLSGTWVTVWTNNHTTLNNPTSSTLSGFRGDTFSDAVVAVVTGGIGPFTYAWSWASGGSLITIGSSTAATCSLSSSTTAGLTTTIRNGTLQCVVTDTGNSSYQTTTTTSVSWTWEGSA